MQEPRSYSILLRGGSEHVVTSLARAMHDALRVTGVAIEDEKILAGGGSPEIELALAYGNTVPRFGKGTACC